MIQMEPLQNSVPFGVYLRDEVDNTVVLNELLLLNELILPMTC